jgi:hypothetical protein
MFGSFGPFFFVEQITAVTHLDMLQLCLLPQLEDHQPSLLFKKDGASPRCACIVQECLDVYFSGCCIDLDAHSVSCLLNSSCGVILRTVLTRPLLPPLVTWSSIVAVIKTVTLQKVENT